MSGDIARRDRPAELTDSLPQTLHSPLAPLGQIEQASKIARGIRHPNGGWRRIGTLAGLALLGVVIIVVLALVIQ